MGFRPYVPVCDGALFPLFVFSIFPTDILDNEFSE